MSILKHRNPKVAKRKYMYSAAELLKASNMSRPLPHAKALFGKRFKATWKVSPKESALQTRLIKLCKAQRWDAWKIVSPGNAGVSDVMVLITDREGRGHSVFVEMKRPGEEPTKLQEHRLNELKRRGFIAGWSDNPDLAFARIFTECKKRGIKL